MMSRAAGRRTFDSVYIGSKPAGMWPVARAREALTRVRSAEAYVWCPRKEWPAVNAQLVATVGNPDQR